MNEPQTIREGNALLQDGDAQSDTLGGRISGARDAAGMSVEELARRIGVETGTLQDWENDRAEPRANKLVTLAGVLNLSLPWLMGGHGEDPSDTAQDSLVRTMTGHLVRLKRLQEETDSVIRILEDDLARLAQAG